jgi:hypothetical protein
MQRIGGETRTLALAAIVALGVTAQALADNGPRSFELARPAPQVGDSFQVDQRSTLVMTTGGVEEGRFETKSLFRLTLTGRDAIGFKARYEIEPSTTTAVVANERRSTTEKGRTVSVSLTPEQVCLTTPVDESAGESQDAATKADVASLVKPSKMTIGETWTEDRTLPVGNAMAVPIKATYKVVGVESDGTGRELIKLELSSEGSAKLGATAIKLAVKGEGTAFIDPAHSERPAMVKITYTFTSTGGGAPDSETRTETTIRTRDLSPRGEIAPTTSLTESSKEKSR